METATDIADLVLPYVPHLRRHARLLCGSQELGDEYVQVCLELVVEEPEQLDRGSLKKSLFAMFHSVWHIVNTRYDLSSPFEQVDPAERLEKGLQELAPLDRQALLLRAVEGFSSGDTADILGIPLGEVEDSLKQAHHKLGKWTAANVLLIEDERIIAFEMEALIEEMGHKVVGSARHEREALVKALAKEPDLVIADIQLAEDGSGIRAAQQILEHIDVPVVFVTGFPERLLLGGRTEPAFVVAKPYDPDALKAMIAHVLALYETPAFAAQHQEKLLGRLSAIVASEREANPGLFARAGRNGTGGQPA